MMTQRLLFVVLLSTSFLACGGEGNSDTDASPQDVTTTTDASGDDTQAPSDVVTDNETQTQDAGAEDAGVGDVTEPAEETGCRSAADCPLDTDYESYCATPYDDTHGCGMEPDYPDYPCEEPCPGMGGPFGGEFPGGSACHAVMSVCASHGIGAYCADPSKNAVFNTPCGDSEPGGELTWNEEGVCAPQSCEDGYACHAVQACDPSAAHSDLHGCAFAACEADSSCDEGLFCVNDKCLDTLGTCALNTPMP
jgi:hypothetical protein